MTTPGNYTPPGSAYVIGGGADNFGQDLTEQTAKAIMKAPIVGAYANAQGGFKDSFASTAGLFREVIRLDNRIDRVLIGNQTVLLYTYSESDIWVKPHGFVEALVVCQGGSSGGGRSNLNGTGGAYRGGAGGWSGGSYRATILGDSLPATVAVTVGAGSQGATADGTAAGAAGDSSFGEFVIATGALGTNYGSGNQQFRVRGGNGGYGTTNQTFVGENGGFGSFHPGGEGGAPGGSGNPGVNGYSLTQAGQIGFGSGGGGGALKGFTGDGGRGGDGGWPSGPGGGGGGYESFGFAGNGGNGAGGAVWVLAYLEDTFGLAPTTPTGLAASAVTSTAADLTWTASTDDVIVAKYEILVDGYVTGETVGIEYKLGGLTPSTAYSVTVRAVDLGGNRSSESAPITVTTTA